MRLFSMRACLLLGALALAACSGDDTTGDDDTLQPLEPHLSSIQANVFNHSCTFSACHNSQAHMGNLDLTEGHSYDALVGKVASTPGGGTLVLPGSPGKSFLMAKLKGNLMEGQGVRMPLGNPPLDDQTIEVIQEWILDGAADD